MLGCAWLKDEELREGFVRGPIPMSWLCCASRLPGRAFQVGLLIWLRVGQRKSRRVLLSTELTKTFGIDGDAKTRALRHLEDAGLVSVERRCRKNPYVTVLQAPAPEVEQCNDAVFADYSGERGMFRTSQGGGFRTASG